MIRVPPTTTRTNTLCPYTTLCRSPAEKSPGEDGGDARPVFRRGRGDLFRVGGEGQAPFAHAENEHAREQRARKRAERENAHGTTPLLSGPVPPVLNLLPARRIAPAPSRVHQMVGADSFATASTIIALYVREKGG